MMTAGDVVEFVLEVTAHHRGHFEFGICDQQVGPATTNAQGCFDSRKLRRAPPPADCVPNDVRGDCQPLHKEYPERWYLPPGTGTHRMRFQIPTDLQCLSCTLQWRWWTANSCVPAADYGCYFQRMKALGWDADKWCGGFCGFCGASLLESGALGGAAATRRCGEEFRNCADIEVRGSGDTSGATMSTQQSTTAPAPAPTTPPAETTQPAAQGPCIRNEDCDANAWCQDPSYDVWCAAQGASGTCPRPQCRRNGGGAGAPAAPAPTPSTTTGTMSMAPSTTTGAPSTTAEVPSMTTKAPSTTATGETPGSAPRCVSRSALKCINDYSSYWPKCSPEQAKSSTGPAGYEFGDYCDEEWVAALNEVLSDPVVDKCGDEEAIRKFLAQVAYETGYYTTVYQPADGGAGLIHMIPGNWAVNAGDMDALWPGSSYTAKAASMGKSFFQTPAYGWRSVAAWFKRTSRVIGGCGEDLFEESYDRQTRCILSRVVDRSEAYDVVGRCLSENPVEVEGVSSAPPTSQGVPVATTSLQSPPAPTTSRTTPATPAATTPATTATTPAATTPTAPPPSVSSCVRNTDCAANPWCTQASYTAWCAAQGAHGACPAPQCKWGATQQQASLLSVAGGARGAHRKRQRFLGTALMQQSRLLERSSVAEEL